MIDVFNVEGSVSEYNDKLAYVTVDVGSGKKQIAVAVAVVNQTLTGDSSPDTDTKGFVGQIFVDTTAGDAYICVGVDDTDPDNIEYTWKQITS